MRDIGGGHHSLKTDQRRPITSNCDRSLLCRIFNVVILPQQKLHRLEPIYEALAAESGHRLTTICPEASVQVMLNQRLLELALDNLMDNACKYTPPGGMVSLTLQVDEHEALITVQDSGKGIPAEESPYIFDRFRRGIDTQSIPGTGLGLAIVQESLKRMGGTVSLESQIGLGTRFLIRLPLNR